MKRFNENFLLLVQFLIKNVLYFTIKFDILLVYTFSQTPFFVFYVFAVIGGFCAGNQVDVSTIFLALFTIYLFGTSFLLMIVCNSTSTMIWVEKLVGLAFIDKYAPKKGKTSFLILFLSLAMLLFVEVESTRYLIAQKFIECAQLNDTIKSLLEGGDANQEAVNTLYRQKYKILESVSNTEGILNKAHLKFPLVNIHSFFNKS